MKKIEEYVGLVLETSRDAWFQDLLTASGVNYEAGANGWGVVAVKAFLGGARLSEIAAPRVGCACIMREAGVEWAGIVIELQGEFLRAVEFGTRKGYGGTQAGWEVQYKRRAVTQYAAFMEPRAVREDVPATSAPRTDSQKKKMSFKVSDRIDSRNIQVSKDAPPSTSLAVEKSTIDKDKNNG